MVEGTASLLVGITVVGVACQWLAWQFRLPAILPLLLAGLLMGPIGGFLDPERLLGELMFPFVSLAVAVILFEGALSLKRHELVGSTGPVVRNLVTVGALITWLVMALAARLATGAAWEIALLFGAVVTVTGPTVVMPLLRSIRPTAAVARVLRWEGIIVDPFGALFAVLVFGFIVAERQAAPLWGFAQSIVIGGAVGGIGALLLGTALKRHWLPGFLVNVATLASVLLVFVMANHLQEESGLLAVTVMGLVLTNLKDVPTEEIIDFKESLSVMLISVLFVILAARIDLAALAGLAGPALVVLAAALFVARPLAVAAATWGSDLTWRERVLIGWVAPRGIVAAAVSAAFALRLDAAGIGGAHLLVPLTFTVIIGTVVLQSLTGRYAAGRLRVAEPEPQGVLIIGAHRVARAVAKALAENGFTAVLADANWDEAREARMEGHATYFGNAISEHADRNLDLVGVGRLLAMSSRPAYNALACLRFRHEFGADRVYALRTSEERSGDPTRGVARPLACTRLFGDEITLAKLSSLLSQGGGIHSTQLSESFDFSDYQKRYRGKAIELFAIDRSGRLRVFTAEKPLTPEPGWKVVALIPAAVTEGAQAPGLRADS